MMTKSMVFLAAMSTACVARGGAQPPHSNAQQATHDGESRPEPVAEENTPDEATAVVEFWREAGPSLWFAKDPEFDRRFRERFLSSYESAARGELKHWLGTKDGALGLIILLDQFPRNSFRGTPRMYATDRLAREMADAAIRAGHDRTVDEAMQMFIYLPFGHSEDLADQERSVELSKRFGPPNLTHAEGHRDIIKRFGRFPHRNAILGRTPRPEELKFLADGGFAG